MNFLRNHINSPEFVITHDWQMGDLVVSTKLPRVGAMRASGYEGDGWVIIQHTDTQRVKQAALELITTVKIKYQY